MKPSIPSGTRDFAPEQVAKRQYIINTIRRAYERYGFLPLETPAMENLSTLSGKYGDEGDQLLFKILNSGDFLAKCPEAIIEEKNAKKLLPHISDKGLRYDLTVPFARFVVMNREQLAFPFKRYQIQPVWRADRPQKGRYREFYQCDGDIIGTDSLLCEMELIAIIQEVFGELGIQDFSIKINHRKILEGVAEVCGAKDNFQEFTVAVDKLDKIGFDGVCAELQARGIDTHSDSLQHFIQLAAGSPVEVCRQLKNLLASSETAQAGLADMEQLLQYLNYAKGEAAHQNIALDPLLARGLSYYTGVVLETVPTSVKLGTVVGGGRYDNLTGIFGWQGMSGVGMSFGLDRIYDLMEALGIFGEKDFFSSRLLILAFEENALPFAIRTVQSVRQAGIAAELYPELVSGKKLKKAMNYANDKKIPHVIFIGSNEMQSGTFALKNMESGEQRDMRADELLSFFGLK